MRQIRLIAFFVAVILSCAPPYATEAASVDRPREKERAECSIETLEKLIVPQRAMLPPMPQDEAINHDRPDDIEWRIWDWKFDTPTSMLVRLISKYGEAAFRVAFMSRHNYVMSEIQFDYADNIDVLNKQNRPITASPGRVHHHFFCDDQIRIPPDRSAYEAEKLTVIGNNQRAWFFGEALQATGLDLSKIPE
jgi:hypothetical protein